MALRIGKKTASTDDTPEITPQPGIPAALLADDAPRRKGLNPLFIVLGVVVLAALAGGAYAMFGGAPAEEEYTPPPVPARREPPPAAAAPAVPTGVPAAPAAPASPGAKPAPAVMSPQLSAQLKQLWDKGAAAKHRNDYSAARAAWGQILKLKPGHPGVQDAIDKLPPR